MSATPRATVELHERALAVIPGAVQSVKRRVDPPLCIVRGNGAYVEDADGKRYIDYQAGLGPVILGHAHPVVNEAVTQVLAEGNQFGTGFSELEVRAAELIVDLVPSVDKVLFCSSGTEATFHAVRLARAATGRERIVKFEGNYNGWHDYLLTSVEPPAERLGKPVAGSAGTLRAAFEATLVCRYNDLERLEALVREHDVAAIVLEPIMHNQPTIEPEPGFLEGVRALCDEHGAVLVFDEVVTGFRHGIGGYQAVAGVTPDLTTMGKAMANGFPVAALGGRAELMDRFNTNWPDGVVHFGGTYNGNAIAMTATIATIETLRDGRLYEHVFELGDRMRRGLSELLAEQGVEGLVSGFGSIFAVTFGATRLRSYDDVVVADHALANAYRAGLVERGVLEPPGSVRSHISASHTEKDVDDTLERAREALRAALR
jgi:glutamate-1-semialdehyde 2,1-aminomutase